MTMTDPTKESSSPAADAAAELAQLEVRVQELRTRLSAVELAAPWWPQRFYVAYHVVVGSMLGLLAAGASLLFNIVGSLMVGRHPLQLIKVYLTFPLGERALQTEDGLALSTGILLYLATGMLFGAAIHVVGQRFFPTAPLVKRLWLATVAGVLLWIVNFYAVLSWMQPLLFGGNWIVEQIPLVVGAATHLVFTWVLTLLAYLGRFEPPVPPARAG